MTPGRSHANHLVRQSLVIIKTRSRPELTRRAATPALPGCDAAAMQGAAFLLKHFKLPEKLFSNTRFYRWEPQNISLAALCNLGVANSSSQTRTALNSHKPLRTAPCPAPSAPVRAAQPVLPPGALISGVILHYLLLGGRRFQFFLPKRSLRGAADLQHRMRFGRQFFFSCFTLAPAASESIKHLLLPTPPAPFCTACLRLLLPGSLPEDHTHRHA